MKGFRAEGPTGRGALVPGLTTLRVVEELPTETRIGTGMEELASKAVNETAMDMNYGLESAMFRTKITWGAARAAGAVLVNIACPFGFLAMGNTNNIQNMAFQRFIYTTFDMEVEIQLNGTRFQQGFAYAMFFPLQTYVETSVQLENALTFRGVWLVPKNNTVQKLKIPFRFYRSAMNTYAGGLGTESLGRFIIFVVSPLVAATGSDSCDISLYTRFMNAKFSIARPILAAAFDLCQGGDPALRVEDEEWVVPEFRAEGANYSKVETKNTYQIHDVSGTVPIETTVKADPSQTLKQDAKVDVEGVPMDNPPIGGCTIPVHMAFPSMSKVVGLEPTTGLQSDARLMNREPHQFEDGAMMIEHIMAREFYLDTINWTTDQATNTPLRVILLNSILRNADLFTAFRCSPQIYLLNQFKFWRADIVFTFRLARTGFHSGRLYFTVAYGAPSFDAADRNVFVNHILDFNDENDIATVRVEYNAATEFLRTYEGERAVEPLQNYAIGRAVLGVAVELRATATVSNTVPIVITAHFENVRVYEAASIPITYHGAATELPLRFATTVPATASLTHTVTTVTSGFRAEGDTSPIVETGETTVEDIQPPAIEMTDHESPQFDPVPCKLSVGRKFEYEFTHINDLLRRHRKLDTNNLTANWETHTLVPTSTVPGGGTYNIISYDVGPIYLRWLYVGWSGHLKYRFYGLSSTTPNEIIFEPQNRTDNLLNKFPNYGWQPSGYMAGPVGYIRNLGYSAKRVEMSFPLPGTNYIDVSIPFDTHFNFLPTTPLGDDNPGINSKVGSLSILSDTAAPNLNWFYEAAGDDFRYHIWCPRLDAGFWIGLVSRSAMSTAATYHFGSNTVVITTTGMSNSTTTTTSSTAKGGLCSTGTF
jgi:hypothetical protein